MVVRYKVEPWGPFEQPASTLFSLISLVQHALLLARYRRLTADMRRQPGSSRWYPWAVLWEGYSVLWMVVYVSAVCFHTRDVWWTEWADYFSVALALCWMVWTTLVRVLSLRSRLAWAVTGVPMLTVWLWHVRFMTTVKFDYGWHVQLGVALGVAHAVLWLCWLAAVRPSYWWMAVGAQVALAAAVPLELVEFRPLGDFFDGHSLWHASATVVAWLTHRFHVADTMAELERTATKRML